MIVDLTRNDVSRLAEVGIMKVRRSGVVGERDRGGEPSGPSGSPDQTTCRDRTDADGAGQGADAEPTPMIRSPFVRLNPWLGKVGCGLSRLA
jgi:hypothetical protein